MISVSLGLKCILLSLRKPIFANAFCSEAKWSMEALKLLVENQCLDSNSATIILDYVILTVDNCSGLLFPQA